MSLVSAHAPHTWLDRANPVTRLIAAVVLSLPLLVTLDVVSGGVAIGLELVAALVVGFRPAYIARRFWPVLLFAPLAALSMALYGKPAGHIWWQWGFIIVSDHSLSLACAVFLRVLALGIPSLLLFAGVDPTDMADGLAQVWHLPARFVLGTLAGLRLTSRLQDDWRSLALARRARGLGDTGAVRRFVGMAFSLLVLAIRRGTRLATAMEARGFGSNERTWARESRVGRPDAVLLVASALIAGTAITAAVLAGTFWFVGS